MSTPNVAAIRTTVALSDLPTRGPDPILACNVCGEPSDDLRAWREHNERDAPLSGSERLIFVGEDHPGCRRKLDEHPRLYAEETGRPGTFPKLCGPCTYRRGFECSHPQLTKNGGAGLRVQLEGGFPGVVCMLGANGPIRQLRRAVECGGRALAGDRVLPPKGEP